MDDFNHNTPFSGDDQRQFSSNWFWGGLFNSLFPGSQQGGYPNQPGPPWQGGYPGQPGPGFPGQPGIGTGGPPSTPPPPFTPEQPQMLTKAVDPGAIQGCLYRNTYIWMRRQSFWFYPVYIGFESIAGYRWQGQRWVYFGVDLDRIRSFQCY